MTARKLGPSKEDAAEFLRELAYWRLRDDPRAARKLKLVADCIAGKIGWSRGSAFSVYWRKRIWLRATVVNKRDRGVTVKEALDAQAEALARDMGLSGKDDVETLRGHIDAMRKRIRADERKKESGSKN